MLFEKSLNINLLVDNYSIFARHRLCCLSIMLSLFNNACIEPYDAEIDGLTELISIEGSIIKGDPLQHVVISTTTSVLEKEFKPLRGCEVIVLDELNNEFIFAENFMGTYSLTINDDLLVNNRKYKLMITTPTGDKYESQYETINSTNEIDTVYYEIEKKIETFSNEEFNGLQFYIDVKASDSISRYFRWNLTETYEYTTTGFISYINRMEDEEFEKYIPPDKWKVYRCWVSKEVPGIYVSNTINLTVNEKKKIPLQYVSTLTNRLKIKYSLLVSQYTLNEGAYNYWQQNKIATEESGGLYTSQPGQTITNLNNVNNSTEKVLGYFWASSRTENRIFIPRINEMVVNDLKCEIYVFDPMVHKSLPRYIRVDEKTGYEMTGHPNCFDCTLRGGKITKPDFWE